MEKLIPKEFDLSNKDRSDEALMRWRKAVGLVKNRRRRFRYAADLAKRSEAKAQMLKIRVCAFSFSFSSLSSEKKINK